MSRRTFALVSVPVVTFLLLAAARAQTVAPSSTRTVTGRVTDVTSGLPIPRLVVVVEGTDLGSLTADSGTFRVLNVPGGTQQLVLRHPCYLTTRVAIPDSGNVELPIAVPQDPATRLVLKPGCVRYAPTSRDDRRDRSRPAR